MAVERDEQDSPGPQPPRPTMEPDPSKGQRWRESRARQPSAAERAIAKAVPSGIPAQAAQDAQGQQTKARGRKRSGTPPQLLVEPQVPMLDVAAALKEITQVPAATI